MAAETGTVWAIDIGNNSLKALCLSTERGVVEVVGNGDINKLVLECKFTNRLQLQKTPCNILI